MSAAGAERIETPQLLCERIRDTHAQEMLTLLLDPRVARTLWPRDQEPTATDVLAGLAGKIEHWERHGFGLWLLRDRRTGEMVGRGGLQFTYVPDLSEIEAAWAIVPERWGEGLATELALATVDVAFNRLGLLRIIALTLPDNIASRRVMEKAGFGYERDVIHAGLPHVLYTRRPPA
jgi:[ribosomal protein S5]-alanine N-acetyltransferase